MAGCAGRANLASPTAARQSTSIAQPTQTLPLPTAGRQPTSIAQPTQTPQPERYPAWVSESFGNIHIEYSDDFDSLSPNYAVSPKVTISRGQAVLPAPGQEDVYGTYWIDNRPLSVGQAVLIRFRYDAGSNFSIGLRAGEYGTPNFHWIGVNENSAVNAIQAKQDLTAYPIRDDVAALSPNTWYDLLFAIKEGGDFIIQVAPVDDLENLSTTRVHYSDNWAAIQWNFSAFLFKGELLLERYVSLAYTGYPDVPVLPAAQQCSGASGFPQQLHTQGNRIVDESGQEVMLRGIAIVDPVIASWELDPGNPALETSFKMISSWGANIVRIPVHPQMWRIAGRRQYLHILDQSIAWACQNNLYVILDYHSLGFPPYDYSIPGDSFVRSTEQEVGDFWQIASARYAGNQAVAFFELFNEPVTASDWQNHALKTWLDWKSYMEEIIDLARQNAPEKIVIVGGLAWSQYLEYAPQYPVDRPNVVYGMHPYPGSEDWEINIGQVNAFYPVMATEFGFEPNSPQHWSESNHHGSRQYRYEIIDYLETHGVSWVVWIFSNSWGPPLLNPDFSPSEAGAYFREQLLKFNR